MSEQYFTLNRYVSITKISSRMKPLTWLLWIIYIVQTLTSRNVRVLQCIKLFATGEVHRKFRNYTTLRQKEINVWISHICDCSALLLSAGNIWDLCSIIIFISFEHSSHIFFTTLKFIPQMKHECKLVSNIYLRTNVIYIFSITALSSVFRSVSGAIHLQMETLR